jgi:carboxypeptidase C (cathepsin A)
MASGENETLHLGSAEGVKGVTVTATLIEDKGEAKSEDNKKDREEAPVVTHHAIAINGETLHYSVTTGMLPIKNETGETEAHIFFMAYAKEGVEGENSDTADRPLMFSFNGGPGSSSVWLHLGALGPKRVQLLEDGNLPAPPYRMVDNPHTWLDKTDLVFLDPVGTGYSRPTKPDLGKKFWSLEGDIASVGEFIRLYLTRYERWASPLYLVGESYGTTRAAGLAGYLIDKGIAFNGIVLVSSILNFQTALFEKGNDLPYVLFLPTYAATAWYHRRLAPELQADLRQTLQEAEQWALSAYALALAKGDALNDAEKQEVIGKLSRYTGLSERFVADNNLRVEIHRFCKELLRAEKRTVGRLDSRIMGRDAQAAGDTYEFDPSMTTIRPPYTAVFNHYARTQLGYKTDMPYYVLGESGQLYKEWDWNLKQGYADTSEALRSAFAKNPHMRLFVASGYFDLATPYFATDYTLNHMNLSPETRANVVTADYEAGHMMYIHAPSLIKLKTDVAKFLGE